MQFEHDEEDDLIEQAMDICSEYGGDWECLLASKAKTELALMRRKVAAFDALSTCAQVTFMTADGNLHTAVYPNFPENTLLDVVERQLSTLAEE